MKNKRSLLSLLLACATLANVGCAGEVGDTSETTRSTETTTAETVELDEQAQYPLPDRNMDGFTLRFFNYDNTWLTWAMTQLTAESENGDNINDEVYRRNERIKQKYNCDITETQVRNTDDAFGNIVMSNDDLYDIAMLYDERIATTYSSGYIESWDVFEYVDTSRSWWNQDANDVFSLKGEQFAAVGDFSLGMASRGFILLFNKNLISNADLDVSIYDMVSDGTWTLDNYADIAKLFTVDINGDSVIDGKDQWGAGGAVKQYFGCFITGAGIKYVETDDEGTPYFTIPGNERAINVMESILNIHSSDKIYFLGTESDVHNIDPNTLNMFKGGQIAFIGRSINGINSVRDMDADIGIVPFPKYDEAQSEYHVLTSGTGVAAIPITLSSDRYENVGILIDALSRDSQKGLLKTYREVVLKSKYTRDAESSDMLDIIFRSGVFDLGLSVWPSETYYKYMESYLNMTDNFTSLTESINDSVSQKIDEMLLTIEKNME